MARLSYCKKSKDGYCNASDVDIEKCPYLEMIEDIARAAIKDNHKPQRLIQCHADSKNMWQYYNSDEFNPCGCESNCFHYEYDKASNKIYGVCNACHTDIYEVKEDFVSEMLKKGIWIKKI